MMTTIQTLCNWWRRRQQRQRRFRRGWGWRRE